ncbi:hypothetical protein CR513_11445, partial [Mucuna pruriens]
MKRRTNNLLIKLISMNIYQNSNVIDSGSLIDNLFMFDVDNFHNEILQTSSRGNFRYGYLYLKHEKSLSVDIFKSLAEVEL